MLLGGVIAALGGCASVTKGPASVASEPATPDVQIVRLDVSATLSPGQLVAIDNPYGDVRLRFGGYEHALEIHAVAQEPANAKPIALNPAVVDDRYEISPRLPAGTLLVAGQRLDMVVFVPLGHPVRARTEQGTIESRGIRDDVELRSTSGDISVRGTHGRVSAETGPGSIEASLGPAPAGSKQRLATTSGNIVLALADDLDAHLELATSAAFATEFSLQVTPRPGQEPNKNAVALVGSDRATITVESKRGEIRLLRWSEFRSSDGKTRIEEDEEAESDSD